MECSRRILHLLISFSPLSREMTILLCFNLDFNPLTAVKMYVKSPGVAKSQITFLHEYFVWQPPHFRKNRTFAKNWCVDDGQRVSECWPNMSTNRRSETASEHTVVDRLATSSSLQSALPAKSQAPAPSLATFESQERPERPLYWSAKTATMASVSKATAACGKERSIDFQLPQHRHREISNAMTIFLFSLAIWSL